MTSYTKTNLLSIATGVGYGLFCRWIFGLESMGKFMQIMSSSFIIVMPLALGFVTIVVHRSREDLKFWHFIILPWISGVLALIFALLLVWEGLICVILWLPLVMILASVGGFLAWVMFLIIKPRRNRMYCAAVVGLLPFAIAPIETLNPPEHEMRTVVSRVVIEAPVDVVWKNIATVPAITEKEHRFSWVHAIGFPRPIEAKLIGEGVGAVRHATFEGDVLFLEYVTEWKENQRLSFTIDANTDNIPPETFDEHVTIGGPYFDVLNGSYEIEPLGDGKVLLHLSSQQRLSTNFNFYSHLWTEWLMDRIQAYILEVIKERCEAGQVPGGETQDARGE